jgi:hypothetical protein
MTMPTDPTTSTPTLTADSRSAPRAAMDDLLTAKGCGCGCDGDCDCPPDCC